MTQIIRQLSGVEDPTHIKHFVLDTNVLLHNPNALYMFDDNQVIVPFAVLEELDKFKKANDDVGRSAREVIRQLDRLRQKGRLADGVAWNDKGGSIRVDFAEDVRPKALTDQVPDNRIIGVAWGLKERGFRSIMITKDINVRLKSDSLGIQTEDFEAQKVDIDHLYAGYTTLDVAGELIDQLYEEKQLEVEALAPSPEAGLLEPLGPSVLDEDEGLELHANQFVQLRNAVDESHTGLARRLADTDHLIPVHGPRKPVTGIMARNVQQTMALDLLLDDEIKLLTLLGTAGTGKTLLALAAGMTKVFAEQRYDKLLVARPIMPMGRDIGYLPGDKDEKLSAWMQPIFDNLQYLLSTRGAGSQHAESKQPEQRIEYLMSSGQLVLEPLTYIRGRSIPHQFMIIDEAQNLTPHEVKTIVSRVGEGTKIVLTGDIAQIDNPYLDASSNGLSFMVERLKGEALVGHVLLARTERSELASLAAEKL
ncbi:PhoH family protein [Mucisphaera calidilacus]|uniref:PhoH-like protein n=1 Tax=Mucisphaera calidilacus TaxID=2527982 RepID=A0A518BTY8_9BACT|nr:PhoH family protein [Mucisphaera calidilacus]QDU70424.1 PhoH-like protein [Mucisphaera calidilacus]